MKLAVDRFVHEPPGISIIPETEFEAAMLSRYRATAKLSKGMAASSDKSADGFCYGIRFSEEKAAKNATP
jgi:hypothetical protein